MLFRPDELQLLDMLSGKVQKMYANNSNLHDFTAAEAFKVTVIRVPYFPGSALSSDGNVRFVFILTNTIDLQFVLFDFKSRVNALLSQ